MNSRLWLPPLLLFTPVHVLEAVSSAHQSAPQPAMATIQPGPTTPPPQATPTPGNPAPVVGAPPSPAPPSVTPSHAGPLFQVDISGEPVAAFLARFAKVAGIEVRQVGDLFRPLHLHLNSASTEEVLAAIAEKEDLVVRRVSAGLYQAGYRSDLVLADASPTDTTLVDIIYRPNHIDAHSIGKLIGLAFPELKVFAGPKHLTPTLEGGGGGAPPAPGMFPGMPGGSPSPAAGNGVEAIKVVAESDVTFHRYDLSISGPANEVKRAMLMVHRMDRPRRQVRVNVKMTEMTRSAAQNLGVNWDFSPVMTLQELPRITSGTFSGNPGLSFGSFAHTPATVNLQLQASETKGEVKTLANPSLMMLDGERSFLLLGSKYLYPKQNGTTSTGQPTYDTAELKTGIYLQLAVHLDLDGSVLLTAYPQNSYVSGSQLYSGVQYPIVSTREAQTTVRLRNGEMMAIGGLKQDSDTTQVNRIPFLGAIPGLASLFGSNSKAKSLDQLVIFIQPEILGPDEAGPTSIKKLP